MRRISGVSLIELMVALAIGSLLVLGLVEVFSASRTAYQLSEGLSRVQENSRFAMDYIQRDFRMGGHMGCVNDQSRFLPENAIGPRSSMASTFLAPADQLAETYAGSGGNLVPDALRFDLPVQGYEANGTAAGDPFSLPATPVINNSAAAWTPQIPLALSTALNNRIAGSDILVLRQFSPRGAQVTTFTPGDPTAVIQVPVAQFANLVEDQADPGLFGIADCTSAGVFSATATNPALGTITVSSTGANLSPMAGAEPYVAGQAFVYVAQTIVYYVGLTNPPAPAPRVPALYRLRYTMAPGAAVPTFVSEELVEGIESMQLQYGVDSFVAGRPSGNMGTTVVAGGVTDWRRVGAVQVGLVARSVNPAAATQRDAGVAKLSALGVTFTSPNDGRFRTVYENTIAMRNRLFGH